MPLYVRAAKLHRYRQVASCILRTGRIMVAAIVPGQLLTLSNVWDALVVGNEDLHVVPVLVEHGRLIQVFIRESHEVTYEFAMDFAAGRTF